MFFFSFLDFGKLPTVRLHVLCTVEVVATTKNRVVPKLDDDEPPTYKIVNPNLQDGGS